MDGADLSVRIVAVNKELLEAQENLAIFEEAARRSGLAADQVQVETWQHLVERLTAELDDLMAQARAEADEIDRALAPGRSRCPDGAGADLAPRHPQGD